MLEEAHRKRCRIKLSNLEVTSLKIFRVDMDVRNAVKRCIFCILLMNVSIISFAQDVSEQTIEIVKTVISESTIRLERVTNNSGYDIEVITRNGKEQRNPVKIPKGGSKSFNNIECTRIQANPLGAANGGGGNIWNERMASSEWNELQNNQESADFKLLDRNPESDPGNPLSNNPKVSDNTRPKIITIRLGLASCP